MEIIEQSSKIEQITDNLLEFIEKCGRIAYKSEDKISGDSAIPFINKIISNGHESVLEHGFISIKFVTSRSVTHELVRHRLASYTQESTRYVKYSGHIQFIRPVWLNLECKKYENDEITNFFGLKKHFLESLFQCEKKYNILLNEGCSPQQAREVLPNSLKTEIIMTANLREWRHVFKLRTSNKAHSQIRSLMVGCLTDIKTRIPIIFDNI